MSDPFVQPVESMLRLVIAPFAGKINSPPQSTLAQILELCSAILEQEMRAVHSAGDARAGLNKPPYPKGDMDPMSAQL